MPNWPISMAAKNYLRRRSMELASRTLAYANGDFPLTVDQIQYAVMPAERVKTMRRLISDGVKTIERHRVLRLAFLREKFPELRRGAVIHVELPEWIVVDRGTSYGMHTTKFDASDHHYLVPDFSLNPTWDLNAEQRAELIDWINRCIRQKRLHEIMNWTTSHVLDKHAPTVAHLHQLWPMLCTLINSDPSTTSAKYYKDREFFEMWRDRFRAPKRALMSYKPKPGVLDEFAKLIKACDTMLASGIVLAPYEADDKQISAELQQWEPIDGDRTF